MSTVREDYGVLFEVYVGTEKTLEITIEDADGNVQPLTDTNVYTTGNFKIVKPDLTIISTLSIVYFDRPNGIIQVTVPDTVTVIANAGNWIGDLELINVSGKIVDQKRVNINILESS